VNKPITSAGQAYLQGTTSSPSQNYRPQGKIESWVDLHSEYSDVLDQNELQKFRRHFRAMGANDSGFLTADALKEIMETFFGQDLSKSQAQESIAQIDYDGDGQISYREFLEAMCAQKTGKKTKFGGFYHVLTLKNPPFWSQRVSRANAV
jgi:Ca2+-binding EF-hand superfamily protein